MSVSDSFVTFVLEQLAGVREISSRRMFGGVGLYSAEWFFAVLDNDTLFFKVDDASVGAYKKRRMRPFQPMPDMPPMMGYYQVPPRFSKTPTRWPRGRPRRLRCRSARKPEAGKKGKGQRSKGKG